jgi:hypothetical protein
MPVNYQNGKIYALRSHQTDDVYIGSTIQPLSTRKSGHRRHYNAFLKNPEHFKVSSYAIIQYDDAYIELVEHYPCNSKEELHKREGEIMRETENCVNKLIAGRTDREWRDDNKEIISQQRKQFRKENKEILKEKSKKYYADNREALIEKKKQYHQQNRERLTANMQKRYDENREEILEKLKEKYTCGCGSITRKQHKARHKKTKSHIKWLEAQEEIIE